MINESTRALVVVTQDQNNDRYKKLWQDFMAKSCQHAESKQDDYCYKDIGDTKIIFVKQQQDERATTTTMKSAIDTFCTNITGPIHIFYHANMVNRENFSQDHRIKFPVEGFVHEKTNRVWNKIDELLKCDFDKELLEFFFDYLKMFWPTIQSKMMSLLIPLSIDFRGVAEVWERNASIGKNYLDEILRNDYKFCQRLADIRYLISKNASDKKISEAIKTFRRQDCGDRSLETLIEDSKYKEQLRDQLEKLEYLFGVENDHDRSPIFKFFSMLDSLSSNTTTEANIVEVLDFFKNQANLSDNIVYDSEDKPGWDPYGTKDVCIQSFADWFEEIKKVLKAIQRVVSGNTK